MNNNILYESFGSGVAFQYLSVLAIFIPSSLFYFSIAHILPVNIVGSISLLYALLNISTAVFALGLSKGLQHYMSYHISQGNNIIVMELIKKTVLISAVLATTAFISIYFLSGPIAILLFHNFTYSLSIKIIGIAISASVLVIIFSSILLGLSQFVKYSLIYIFVNIFIYMFPLTLLVIYKNYLYLVIGIAIINVINAIIFIFFVYRSYRKLSFYKINMHNKPEPYNNLIRYSMPLFLASFVGTSATYIDRIVVSYFINLSDLGIYNFALLIVAAGGYTIYPIRNLLLPKLSSFFSLDNKFAFNEGMRMLLNITSLIYIPAALGIAALSKVLLFVFAGPEYIIAWMPLSIIMVSSALFIGTGVLASGISSIRRNNIFVISSVLSLESNLLLSIILIPKFYIMGAAIAYSSMSVINFIIIYPYARKYKVSNYDIPRIIKIWLASIIMATILFELKNFFAFNMITTFSYIVLGMIIYLIEIKLFKLVSTREMGFIVTIMPKKLKYIKNIMLMLAFNDKRGYKLPK